MNSWGGLFIAGILALIPLYRLEAGLEKPRENSIEIIERFLELPSALSPEVSELEVRIIEAMSYDCVASQLRVRLQCAIDSVRAICTADKKLSRPDCLAWADLFTTFFTSGRAVFHQQDQWRLRHARRNQLSQIMHGVLIQHAQELQRIYSLAAPPCRAAGDTHCEAWRIRDFCIEYGAQRGMPAPVCVSLLVVARAIR